MKHTSVPWSLRDIPHQGLTIEWKEGAPVCHMRWTDGLNKQTEERVEANAQFIVKAVNSFYLMLGALNDIVISDDLKKSKEIADEIIQKVSSM